MLYHENGFDVEMLKINHLKTWTKQMFARTVEINITKKMVFLNIRCAHFHCVLTGKTRVNS